jgi:ribosome biogenesis GTPase
LELSRLGWSRSFESHFEPFAGGDAVPGRVSIGHPQVCRVWTEAGETLADVSGRLRHDARGPQDLPVTGDWVALKPPSGDGRGVLLGILPRRSRISRKVAGTTTDEQVLAANVDVALLVLGLDGNYNPRRLERYLVTAWDSGASPVVVLNKTDVCHDLDARLREIEAVAAGVPVHAISSLRGDGLEALSAYLSPGRTLAVLGSSGVGKSTLINVLLGADALSTQPVRESDDRGRHTTTRRELLVLPGGGLIVDTPGMRELQLWGGDVDSTFADVASLADACLYRDCRHEREPRCAVRAAAAEGRLAPGRLESYHKLRAELSYQERRQDQGAQLAEKRRWKAIHRAARKQRREKA